MSCTTTCIQPSPSQAHCGACHVTFGGITGFDRHRRDGQCLTPEAIGHTDNGRGVYRLPMTEARAAQLAAMRTDAPSGSHRTPQTAEQASGVDGSRGGDSSGPTGRTGVDRASWVAGCDRAVAILRGVAARSGSEAARWAADYLAADPDRWRMNEDCWHSTDGSECPGSGPNCAPGGAA